jgi:YHS domain-containing protein
MVRRNLLPACLALAFVVVSTVWAVEHLDMAKCPISGEDVTESSSVEFAGGKVFMCCDKCVKAFDAKNEEHVTKANHQLAVTHQANQTGCPFSGHDVADGTTVTIAGADVGFCCDKCKAKVEGAADDDARIAMVFSAANFAKGFKVEESHD